MSPGSLISLFRSGILLSLAAAALAIGGCASSSSASKADEKNPFASYPVADILAAGNKALDSGETERAVYIYMQALEIEQSAETWYRIGVGKARLGDKGYAWQAFKKAIELDPAHVGAQEELGLTYMAMAQPEQAVQHLKIATDLDPMRWRAWNGLGVLADMDKRYAEAVEYYHAGLIAAPQSPMLMTNIGYSYYLAGNMQDAGAWFGRALIAEANYPPAVKNLALLYARQGWYDQAVKTFSRVIAKPQAYNDVGYIAMRQGDYDEAHELLTEAIRLSPVYYEKAYENLELLKKQMAAEGKEDPAAAALNASGGQIVVAEGQAPRKASVTAEILNVRSGPESDSDIVTHLKAGDPVEVIMTMPDWAFVNYRPSANDPKLTGWVNSRYVGGRNAQYTLAAAPEEAAPVAESAVAAVAEASAAAAPAAAGMAVADLPVVAAAAADPADGAPITAAAVESQEVSVEPATVITVADPVPDHQELTVERNAEVAGEAAAELAVSADSATLPEAATLPEDAGAAEIAAATGAGESIKQTEILTVAEMDAAREAAVATSAATDLPSSVTTASVAAVSSDSGLNNQVARKLETVCEPGSQAEKTPQGAGSCIGVASLSADN